MVTNYVPQYDDDIPPGWEPEEYEYYRENPRVWGQILEALGPEATVLDVVEHFGGKSHKEILAELAEMFPPQSDEEEEALDDLAWNIYHLVP